IGERWEFVLQGRLAHDLLPDSQGPNLADNGVFLKCILREGSLQDKSGPSIATEFGLLLPSTRDEPGTGARLARIVSPPWQSFTPHLNAEVAMTRQQFPDTASASSSRGPTAGRYGRSPSSSMSANTADRKSDRDWSARSGK